MPRLPVRRLRIVAVGAMVFLLAVPAFGAPGDVFWEAEYDGGGNDIAYDLVVAPDGSAVYAVGRSRLDTYDFATAAFDATTGAELWSQRYDAGRRDYAVTAVSGPDGAALFVTGPSVHNTLNFATIAYDTATGEVIWTSDYDGPEHLPDVPTSMAIAPDGATVFVAGTSGGRGHRDYRTVALTADDGSVLWSRRYGTREGFDVAADVIASSDGSAIFVTGTSVSLDNRGHDRRNGATIAYQAGTGDLLWRINVERFTGYGLAASPDGTTVYVVGPTQDARGYEDYMTIELSASTGEIQWKRRYSTALGWEEPSGLAVGLDGNVYVTGSTEQGDTTFAYSPSGQQLWKVVAPPVDYGDAEIALSTDGATVFLSTRPSNEEIMTLAFDAASGAQTWSHTVVRDSIGAGRDLSL